MIERIIDVFTDPEVVPRLRTFIMMMILFKVLTVAVLRIQVTALTRGLDVLGSIGLLLSLVLLTLLIVCKRFR
ncbi:MAG: hypothetical protein HPY81_05055 [Firmicutes bacterium]|nr:hypothetical protein [Bacillota bacterium]